MSELSKEVTSGIDVGEPIGIESSVPCIEVGDWVFLSGQTGVDETGAPVSLDFEPQVRQALSNLKAVLKSSGSSLDDIVQMTVWLTDMRYLEDFNTILTDTVGDDLPPSTLVGTRGLVKPELLIEIEVRAIKSDSALKKERVEVPGVETFGDGPSPAQALSVGDWVFLSGQVGLNPDSEPVSLEFEPQVQRVFDRMEQALSSAGSDLVDLAHMTYWPTDLRYTEPFTNVRSEALGHDVTTSTRVGTTELLRPELLVQVECQAIRSDSKLEKTVLDPIPGLPVSTVARGWKTFPRYWQALTFGDWVYLAGQTGRDSQLQVDPAFEPQVRQAYESIQTALDAADADLSDVIHQRVHLTDMRYLDQFIQIRDEILDGAVTTTSIVGITGIADPRMSIEIETVAVKSE